VKPLLFLGSENGEVVFAHRIGRCRVEQNCFDQSERPGKKKRADWQQSARGGNKR